MAAPRARVALATALVPLALTLPFVLGGCGADDDADAAPDPSPTTSTPAPVDPASWCTNFRAFADAQAAYVAAPDDPAAEQALEAVGERLLTLRPAGLGDDGLVGLEQLVVGALPDPQPGVTAPTATPEEQAAFNDFLADACPA